jgi:anti-anti-sigma factor
MSFLASELDQEFSVEHPAFQVRLRTHRRTVLVQLFGELDLVTVPRVAVALDGINLEADGYRHVVLDLSGLTFMDATGIHELIRQSNHANQNQHNLAVVRGPASISRLMSMTDADTHLVLIDSLEDLLPPLTTTPLY